MTKHFADGRPAEQDGRTVRYDAGGKAHTLPSPDPLLQASARDVRRQLDKTRNALMQIEAIALDDDAWPKMMFEVRSIIARALDG